MKTPIKISPSPVVDATLEIRFTSSIPPQIVLGLLYDKLKQSSEYGDIQELPIMQIPPAVRESDPNFKNKPYYVISSDKYKIQIGPDVVAVTNVVVPGGEYVGWEKFSKEILQVVGHLKKLGAIDNYNRIGLKYLDFFEDGELVDKIAFNIAVADLDITSDLVIGFVTKQEDYSTRVQIASKAQISNQYGLRTGAILDIDTYFEVDKGSVQDLLSRINDLHSTSRDIFFRSLKKEFLSSLNPIYPND